MDLERLDEAFETLDKHGVYSGGPDSLGLVFAAARAYRDLLANGERVEWCEEHGASSWSDVCHVKDGYPNATLGRCRIVSKLLVDTPTEED